MNNPKLSSHFIGRIKGPCFHEMLEIENNYCEGERTSIEDILIKNNIDNPELIYYELAETDKIVSWFLNPFFKSILVMLIIGGLYFELQTPGIGFPLAAAIIGIILYFADKCKFDKKISSNLNLKIVLYIGCFQILALIPGVSRAGITMTASRFLRFNRFDSSKISFLLAIPALAGASVLNLKDIIGQSFEINYLVFIAITLSFLFSYFTVKFFLKYINKFSLNIFIIYRVIVGIILLLIIYN